MTAPDQLPGSPTAGSNDLRDRIAEALNHAFAYVTASGQGTTTGFVAWTDFADAVMAEVQPELDAKDLEIAEAHDALMANLTRAEAAEAQLRDQQNGDQT